MSASRLDRIIKAKRTAVWAAGALGALAGLAVVLGAILTFANVGGDSAGAWEKPVAMTWALLIIAALTWLMVAMVRLHQATNAPADQ